MKFAILVFVLLVLNYQSCQANSHYVKNCTEVEGDLARYYGICGIVMCHEDGSMESSGCPLMACPGKWSKWKEIDLDKDFPDCCDGPICEENDEENISYVYNTTSQEKYNDSDVQ